MLCIQMAILSGFWVSFLQVHVPDNLSMAAAAPLLCAGITVYSPLRYYGMDKPGTRVRALTSTCLQN